MIERIRDISPGEWAVGGVMTVALLAGTTACGANTEPDNGYDIPSPVPSAEQQSYTQPNTSMKGGPEETPTPPPPSHASIFRAIVVNAIDASGGNGVWVDSDPDHPSTLFTLPGDTQIDVDCITPGHRVVDTNVPAGTPNLVSNDWYRIVDIGTRAAMKPVWMGNAYVYVQTPGTVPPCTPAQRRAQN